MECTEKERDKEIHEDTEKEHGWMDRQKYEECEKWIDGWINAWKKINN